ncbi:MAG: helix-turn-helix domain-containing protein [Methylococcales bacterium]
MPTHVPHLKSKIQRLYGRNPEICNQRQLAGKLEISETNLSNILNRDDETVPDKHLNRICELTNIQRRWMEKDDLPAFEQHLNNALTVRSGPWHSLVRDRAQDYSGLRLVRVGNGTRFRFPDAPKTIDRFRFGEKVYIEIEIPMETWHRCIPGQAHMLLLNEQADRIQCICPRDSSLVPPTRISARKLSVPTTAPNTALDVDGAGLQRLLLLLCEKPFEDEVHAKLKNPATNIPQILDSLVPLIQANKFGEWLLWQYCYEVI